MMANMQMEMLDFAHEEINFYMIGKVKEEWINRAQYWWCHFCPDTNPYTVFGAIYCCH